MKEKTFKQAYGVLQKHAETLRNQQEPNIDDLLTIVTESVTAFNVCKERIDAVEKALEQALSGAGVSKQHVEAGESAAPESSVTSPSDSTSPDDDPPF